MSHGVLDTKMARLLEAAENMVLTFDGYEAKRLPRLRVQLAATVLAEAVLSFKNEQTRERESMHDWPRAQP